MPRKLLVAKIGVATITYAVLASPIACNLPAPPPPDPDASTKQHETAPSTPSAAPRQ